ncbi:transcriptional regulator [Candidatus Magnetobacterium bavaricum]|uniref:Transcriptional regulator n=1 Tax=Candidatus Magnetobacterium bavaricum TaxID=29290 RepID=A0A0F3GRM1_9BACT|nr:transcriptional regulator [Candidatus Magnetobacterium bavaricum]
MQKALEIHKPVKNMALPNLASKNLKNINSFSMLYFERLFEELQAPGVLVFDDYQDVPDKSILHEVLSKGLSLLPEGINVIIISRKEPPPSYVRFHAKQQINAIGFNEISFTLKETSALIKQASGTAMKDAVIERLYNKTGGWVTGLILTAQQMNGKNNTATYNKSATNQTTFEYFSSEIFEPLDKDVREFLLNTAYFPEFNAEMATRISTTEITEKILASRNRQYFVKERYTDDDVIFAYHDLFRDFLLRQSKEYYGSYLGEIVLQAVDILQQHGYIEQSVQLSLESKNWERFEQLIIGNVQCLIDEGKHTLIDDWFSVVPDDYMQGHPWMLLWYGLNKMYLSPVDSREILESAYGLFKKQYYSEGQLSALCGVIKTFIFQWKDFNPLDYWIAEFETSLIEVYRHTSSDKLRQEVVSGIVAALIFRQPGHRDMGYWLAEAERLVVNCRDVKTRVFVGYNIIMYYLWSGAVFKAGVIVDILSIPAREVKVSPMLRLMYLRAEAMYLYYKLSPKEVSKTVEEGLTLARQTGMHFMNNALLGTVAYISLADGNDNIARECLKKILSHMEIHQCYSSFYYQLASLLEVSKGVFPSAIEYAQRNMEMVQQSGCPFMPAINKYFLAYVLVESGRHDEAMQHVRDIEELGGTTRSGLFVYLVSAIKVLIALKNNDRTQFEDMFDTCVQFANVSGMRTFLPLQKTVALVCKTAFERGIQVKYVNELI